MRGMPSLSPKPVRFDEHCFWVEVDGGRTLGVPIAWFPRLFNGSPEQRQAFELSPFAIHWGASGEDILVDALFEGFGDMTRRVPAVA